MDGRRPYIRISGNKSREIKWWSFQIHISGVKEPTETTDTGLKKYQINALMVMLFCIKHSKYNNTFPQKYIEQVIKTNIIPERCNLLIKIFRDFKRGIIKLP